MRSIIYAVYKGFFGNFEQNTRYSGHVHGLFFVHVDGHFNI